MFPFLWRASSLVAMGHFPEGTDPQSGYRSSDGIYYSKRPPVRIPQAPGLDLVSFLLAPRELGDEKAFVDAPTRRYLTFSLLERDVRVLAAGLYRDLGVRQCDVVMLLSTSCIEFPVIFLAVLALGAVVTTVNPVNTAAEIRRQMKDSGTKFVFTTATLLEKVAGIDQPVVVFGNEDAVPNFRSNATHRFSELLRADPKDLPRVHITQDDTAALLYSSGTTGTSKGVIITHRNFISSICMISSLLPPDQILLLVLPMFHIFGLVLATFSPIFKRTTVVVLPQYDFVKMLTAIQTYRVTYLPLVPPIVISLAKQDLVFKYDCSSLEHILCAAAPLAKETMDACAKRFPNVKFLQGYAMTESTCVGTKSPCDDIDDVAAHFGSSGTLYPNLEAMVVDPATNEPMPPTKQGELWIRGPSCIMKGYLNNPMATSETVDKDGWLHTGDLVLIDRDGYVFVLDRLKELIKYNSNQVAPAELEALLLSHPAVLDCSVIPYPDERAGQIPMAYIVRKPGQEYFNENVVMEWIRKQVAPYKKVRKVAFISAIPKSAAGKILRRELVQLAITKSRL